MRSRRAWNSDKYTKVSFLVRGDAVQEISDMLEYIGENGSTGHSFSIVVDPDLRDRERTFSFDGDGSDDLRDVWVDSKSKRASLQPLRSRRDYGAEDDLNKPQAWTDEKLKEKVDAMRGVYDSFSRPFWESEDSPGHALNGGIVALLATSRELLEGED